MGNGYENNAGNQDQYDYERGDREKAKKYNGFYLRLRRKINTWAQGGKLRKKSGKWTDHFLQYLLVLPDLVHLMIKLFTDRDVPKPVKGYLLVGFAYLISPIDIIPDFIPVAGFVDDLVVMVVVLNKIINSANAELLKKIETYWAGEDDVFQKIKEITALINGISAQIPKSLYNFMSPRPPRGQ